MHARVSVIAATFMHLLHSHTFRALCVCEVPGTRVECQCGGSQGACGTKIKSSDIHTGVQ